MDDLDQRFTSRVAPIWDFEKTHPDAPTEDRLKACLIRESISKPYVEAQAKALERERKAAKVLREALNDIVRESSTWDLFAECALKEAAEILEGDESE